MILIIISPDYAGLLTGMPLQGFLGSGSDVKTFKLPTSLTFKLVRITLPTPLIPVVRIPMG